MSGSGREAGEWLGDPPKCPGVVRRPSRMSASCRVTLPNVREWSEVHQ